jgi:hypothetical protein
MRLTFALVSLCFAAATRRRTIPALLFDRVFLFPLFGFWLLAFGFWLWLWLWLWLFFLPLTYLQIFGGPKRQIFGDFCKKVSLNVFTE